MISFPNGRDVLLRNVQTRIEKHGEDDVPALDLAISVTGGNELLNLLNPGLRAALFKPLSETEGELPLPVDDLPSVRFPLLQCPLKWDREWVGFWAKIAYGASGRADMILGGVKVSKPQIAALIEGGSCEIRFNLSTTDVNEKVIGKLSLMQSHDITLTLTAPDVEEVKPDPGNDPFWPFPKDESVTNSSDSPPVTPEDAFAGTEEPQQ